jgi:hypothetical protein
MRELKNVENYNSTHCKQQKKGPLFRAQLIPSAKTTKVNHLFCILLHKKDEQSEHPKKSFHIEIFDISQIY